MRWNRTANSNSRTRPSANDDLKAKGATLREDGKWVYKKLQARVRMLDNVLIATKWPLPEQAKETCAC